jgi:HEAT repeat protein
MPTLDIHGIVFISIHLRSPEKVMRKLRRAGIILGVIAVITALGLLFPVVFYVPLGALKREAFFSGRPTTYWVRALKREPLVGEALPAGDIGKTLRDGGADAVPVLAEMAASADSDLRAEALRALALMGPAAKGAAPELTAVIERETNSERFLLAADTLAQADPAAGAAALGAVVRNKAEDVGRRDWALTILLKHAADVPVALPAVKSLLADETEDARLRVEAIHVLWRMNQPAGPLLTALCRTADDEKSVAGIQALDVLGSMGAAAGPAVPALRQLLAKPSLDASGQKWGPVHRAAVVRALGRIGPAAGPAVPALIALYNSPDSFLRAEVALALARIGPPARNALAARDAVWGTSIALLAAHSPGQFVALPLVRLVKQSQIPLEAQTVKAARAAVQRAEARGRGR